MTENCSQGHVNSLTFLCNMGISVSRGQSFSQEESQRLTLGNYSDVVKKLNTDGTLAVYKQKLFIYWGKLYLFSEAKLINTKIYTLFNQFQVRTKCTFLNFVVFSFVSSNFFTILIFYSEIVKRKMNIQNFHIWRLYFYVIRSDQSLSRVQLFATPWIAARQASLSITNSRSSLRLMSVESVMPSSYLILCRPLLLLPPISPSIRVFSNESTLHMR